jgi:hypothetical protein
MQLAPSYLPSLFFPVALCPFPSSSSELLMAFAHSLLFRYVSESFYSRQLAHRFVVRVRIKEPRVLVDKLRRFSCIDRTHR